MLSKRSIPWIILTVILFILLTPGVLVVLPPYHITEIKWNTTNPLSLLPLLIHATLFAIILYIMQRFIRKEEKKAKATGQSLFKTITSNISNKIKNVVSKVTGGIVSPASPTLTVSSASSATTPTSPVSPSKPVTTASSPASPSKPVTTASSPASPSIPVTTATPSSTPKK